ncbi:D-amino acid dehydrogenase [Rhodoferax ferrireducens]|uniref:D-amino acid dehydrogenase n=1 Tax=Rhodoferax ferrireducens TaxID=192843 RepID=UPI000E0D7B58|nr:D-amino acid dehydrogenase [Rhodoferax ferrireducens]
MKIAVIGAGIIGVTTAYELACDGHEVTVLERRGAAAEEGSFANAGIVAVGDITAWTAPGMPGKLMQHLFSRYAPMNVRLPLSGRELAWMWRWHRACKLDAYLVSRGHLLGLASYSRERLHHITAELKLEYERSDGHMVLLRSEQDSKRVQTSLQVLRDAGVAFKELNPADARKIESGLNPDTALFSAVHLPDDEVGNCRQFALLLKNEAQRMGVKFLFNASVTQVVPSAGITLGIAGDHTPHHYDAAVMCAGLDSTRLLDALGLKIPLIAVHGYSVSAAIREPLNAPRSAVMDERYKVAISRFGNRVRVAGCAEIGGPAGKKRASALQTLYKVLHDWFPGAANLSSGVQEWKGARPILPDGPPVLGPSGLPGLWLNLGHGASGWGLSCGSARVLADLIGGRAPDLDVNGLGVGRLRI